LNTDAFRVGFQYVPGQVPYDAVYDVIVALLSAVLPFYLGAVMFRSSRDSRIFLTTMVVASLLCFAARRPRPAAYRIYSR
jgi:hypothetical protein